MNKPTRKLVGFININSVKTWKSKYTFATFCKNHNINKKDPMYKLLKEAYNYGETYGEHFKEQYLHDVYGTGFDNMVGYHNYVDNTYDID